MLAAHPVDQRVAGVEDQRAGEEPDRDAAVAAVRVPRLLDELERDGADQHAAAERHHDAEQARADRPQERDRAAEDQRRRGEEAPAERLEHQPASARRALGGSTQRSVARITSTCTSTSSSSTLPFLTSIRSAASLPVQSSDASRENVGS